MEQSEKQEEINHHWVGKIFQLDFSPAIVLQDEREWIKQTPKFYK